MADSDKGSGGGGAFNPKDLSFKPPRPAGEGGFSEPPKSWPHLVGKRDNNATGTRHAPGPT